MPKCRKTGLKIYLTKMDKLEKSARFKAAQTSVVIEYVVREKIIGKITEINYSEPTIKIRTLAGETKLLAPANIKRITKFNDKKE